MILNLMHHIDRKTSVGFGLMNVDEKTESKYSFIETALTWDCESQFQGFTSTNYSVIDQVWDSF